MRDESTCSYCGLTLPITEFHRYPNGRPRPRCKRCGHIRLHLTPEQTAIVECDCGCGTLMRATDDAGRFRSIVNGHQMWWLRRPFPGNFWYFVEKGAGKDACWLWKGWQVNTGYGGFTHPKGVNQLAHRAAWRIATGEVAPDEMDICHTCDTRLCVRNDPPGLHLVNDKLIVRHGHLFLGTRSDNMIDAIEKGRGRWS